MLLLPPVNPSVTRTATPPIPQLQAWGHAYPGTHGPLIDLCQAVPGYAPHPGLLARLAASITPETARYGAIPGDTPLRTTYAHHLSTLHDTPIDPASIAITAGCNQALFATLLAIAAPGDAILLPTPWYFNHAMTCPMQGLEPRPLPSPAAHPFPPDILEAEALIDSRLRAIVLVTPNNPTGAIYPPGLIARFHALCLKHNLWLILDETYRDFLPADAAPHALPQSPWPENLIQLYSFSKSYAIPGHRLGALAAPAALLPELSKILDCLHICPQRPAQAALDWAIPALTPRRAENRAEMARRAHTLRTTLPHPWRLDSLGAYFAYVRHPFEGLDAWQVVKHLATGHGILLLPGPAFAGGPGHLRISFANIDAPGILALADRLGQATPRRAAA